MHGDERARGARQYADRSQVAPARNWDPRYGRDAGEGEGSDLDYADDDASAMYDDGYDDCVKDDQEYIDSGSQAALWLAQGSDDTVSKNRSKDGCGFGPPEQWQLCGVGGGWFEHQGYEHWTREERDQWNAGQLDMKWCVGKVTIRWPLEGCASLLAITYGLMPWLVPLLWVVMAVRSFLATGSFACYPALGLAVVTGLGVCIEYVVKPTMTLLFGARISDRPPESACTDSGMPSEGVVVAYAVMGWACLELALGETVRADLMLAVVVAMAPVPWAKAYNCDHTIAQVTVAAIFAWLLSGALYYARSVYFPGKWHPWQLIDVTSVQGTLSM